VEVLGPHRPNCALLCCRINGKTSKGLTPLHYAVTYGRVEAARELLRFGASIFARTHRSMLEPLASLAGSTPLHIAAISGNREACLLLLQAHVSGPCPAPWWGARRCSTCPVLDSQSMAAFNMAPANQAGASTGSNPPAPPLPPPCCRPSAGRT
jgi:ankyrin repeat protein